jgi:hypothetical protein
MNKGAAKKKDEKPAITNNIKGKEEKPRSKSKTKEEPPKKAEKYEKSVRQRKEKKEESNKNRAKNAYFFFQEDQRGKITKDNPDAKPKEIMTLLGKSWKALDDAGRKKYHDLAAKDKERVQKENDGLTEEKNGKRKRSVVKNESKYIF